MTGSKARTKGAKLMKTNPRFQSSTTSPAIRWRNSVALALCLLLSCAIPNASAIDAKVTELMTKPLEGFPDKEATMILVEYPPGAKDPVHRHNASTFVYVLEGSIIMQMKGGEKVTLHPGEIFYEDPAGIHLVGENASTTKPAKFVAVLVKDKGAPIFVPVTP
jgi:quercetin dioxygenase-like cupin family protein